MHFHFVPAVPDSKPTELMMIRCPGVACKENRPSAAVTVPVVVPLITTLILASGLPSPSLMLPFTGGAVARSSWPRDRLGFMPGDNYGLLLNPEAERADLSVRVPSIFQVGNHAPKWLPGPRCPRAPRGRRMRFLWWHSAGQALFSAEHLMPSR